MVLSSCGEDGRRAPGWWRQPFLRLRAISAGFLKDQAESPQDMWLDNSNNMYAINCMSFIYVCMHMHVEVKGQSVVVGYLPPPCRSWQQIPSTP